MKHVFVFFTVTLITVSLASPFAQAREVGMYGTTDWTSTCSGNDLSHWDDMVQEWYDAITSHSGYSKDGTWIDGLINN